MPIRDIWTPLVVAMISVFCSTVVAQSNAEITELAVSELVEIIIEEEGEPETQLPLGMGVSGDTLKNAPGSGGDPLRTLQALPGLVFTDDEESLPAVRGSRPFDNYFQTDFVPTPYLFHFDGLLSIFHPDLIQSFDIYQSAYGPEFAGVTGGVFDLKLREPKSDRLRATIDVSLLQTGLLVEGPINETQSVYLAGRISYLDLFLADQIGEEDGITIVQFPKYSDYQGKYVWKPSEDNKLSFEVLGAADTAQVEIAEDSIEVDTDPALAGTLVLNELFHQQAIVWDYQASDELGFKSVLAHNFSDSNGEFGGLGTFDVVQDIFILKNHASYTLNPKHDLSLGAQVTHRTLDLDLALALPPCGELDEECFTTGVEVQTTNEKINFTGARAFLKDSWYVTDRLTFYPGVAFQHGGNINKLSIEPRFAAEYMLSEDTVLSAGVGQYKQAPGVLETNRVFGNPDLDPANALHAQVGVQRFFNNNWDFKTELYYKSLDKLVTSDSEFVYSNDAEGFAYGLDTLIRKNLTNRISGWASISLSKSGRKDKRTGESFVFEYDQPFNVSLVGSYKINQQWALGTKVWIHGGAPVTPVIGAVEDDERAGFYHPIYGKLNSDRFPTYRRIDFRIDRTFKRKNDNTMGAYFELINVLGTKNAADYNYNADYTEKEIVSQLSGWFSFGFKATF